MTRRKHEISSSSEGDSNCSGKESTPGCLDLIRLLSRKERSASPQGNERTANDSDNPFENSEQINLLTPSKNEISRSSEGSVPHSFANSQHTSVTTKLSGEISCTLSGDLQKAVARPSEGDSNCSDKELTPGCLDLVRLLSRKERSASPQENERTANDGDNPFENSKQIEPLAPNRSATMVKALRNFLKSESINREYLYMAGYHYGQGNNERAKAICNLVINNDKKKSKYTGEAYTCLANIYRNERRYKEAEEFLTNAISYYMDGSKKDDNQIERLQSTLAAIYEGQGKNIKAIEVLNDILENKICKSSKDYDMVKKIKIDIERLKLQKVGNYHLLGEPIGKGGFASVYVGKHAYLHHDEQVAIKVIEDVSQTDSKFEEFLREAKILSGLSHRNIVKVKDFGVHNDKFAFLVMEYAPHGTLHDRHPNGTPALDLGLVVKYADQIADALAYVHEQKFIHRDVKPRNILVASDGRLLLSDFGLVQIAPSTPTQKPGKAAGTYGYMAPEQLQGKPRPASDQYALGVMVYEWLSGGEHPFFDPQMTLLKQTDAVKDVIIRALHPDPKQRYEKVTDFAKALKQAFILSEAIEKTYSELDIVQFQLTNR